MRHALYDEVCLEVRYFPVDELPEMSPSSRLMLLEGVEAMRGAPGRTTT